MAVYDAEYYVSSGRKGAMYTIRKKFKEPTSYGVIDRDWHVMNLATDPEKAQKKIENFEEKHRVKVHGDLFQLNPRKKWERIDPDVFMFGKYYGETIQDVLERDKDYVIWAAQNARTSSKVKPEFIKNLRKAVEKDLNRIEREEKERERQLERIKSLAKKKNEWIVDFLSSQSSPFCGSIKKDLEKGKPINELPDRALSILSDIYGKSHGRRNSKKYNTAVDEFWKKVKESTIKLSEKIMGKTMTKIEKEACEILKEFVFNQEDRYSVKDAIITEDVDIPNDLNMAINMEDPQEVNRLMTFLNNMDDRVRGDIYSAFQAPDINKARSEINSIQTFTDMYKDLSDLDRTYFKKLINNMNTYKWQGLGGYWGTEPAQLAGFGIPEFDAYAKAQITHPDSRGYRPAFTKEKDEDEFPSDHPVHDKQERLESEEEVEEGPTSMSIMDVLKGMLGEEGEVEVSESVLSKAQRLEWKELEEKEATQGLSREEKKKLMDYRKKMRRSSR